MTDIYLEILTKGSAVPMINTITLQVGDRTMIIDRRETGYDHRGVKDVSRWTHTTITFHDCYEWDNKNEKPISPDELDRAVMERTSPEDAAVSLVDLDIEDDAPAGYGVIPLKVMIEDDDIGDVFADVDYDALDASENYEYCSDRLNKIMADPEFRGQLVNTVEDFLFECGVTSIPSSEKEKKDAGDTDDENTAIIYGTDYGRLADALTSVILGYLR